MDALSPTRRSAETSITQPTAGDTTTTTSDTTTASSSEFSTYMRQLLGDDDSREVSEEDLFAAVVQQRIQSTKGTEAAAAYDSLRAAQLSSEPSVGNEKAGKSALSQLVTDGTLTATEADSIYSESFYAAQLDENTDALFDARGGPQDPTRAVAELAQALALSEQAVSDINSGAFTAPSRLLSEPTLGVSAFSTETTPADGTAGIAAAHSSTESDDSEPLSNTFLFKPVSDSTGKLAILTPSSLAGEIQKVVLEDLKGNSLEEGAYGGNGNGGRDHFRFSRPGASYPSSLIVNVHLTSGATKQYRINDSSERIEV